MLRSLVKTRVIVELTEEEPIVVLLKRKLYVHAKVIAVGSEVADVKPGDLVMVFNEGREIKRGTRVIDQLAITIKF